VGTSAVAMSLSGQEAVFEVVRPGGPLCPGVGGSSPTSGREPTAHGSCPWVGVSQLASARRSCHGFQAGIQE